MNSHFPPLHTSCPVTITGKGYGMLTDKELVLLAENTLSEE